MSYTSTERDSDEFKTDYELAVDAFAEIEKEWWEERECVAQTGSAQAC